jgi:transposase
MGDVCTRRTGKSVKQMFWAGFGQTIRTGLVPLNGDLGVGHGGINSRHIEALYQAQLPEFVFEGDIFIHDNAPVHTARIVQRLLQELGIEVMIWPPYSPDLNPIKNLWAIMKQEIYKLYPDLKHAPDTADTLEWLIRAVKEAWNNIDNQILERLSNTMPHRVKAVIEANGWYTKY